MTEKLIFKPRARLILEIGEQLIRNESIALLELVKNAYDADASIVKVTMRNIDDPDRGIIIVEDDGCGMTPDIVRNVWMEPGSDFKKKIVQERKRTPKFGRLPLGEKGIGRFAAHKLGNKIEVITKTNNEKEVLISIDWSSFEKEAYLEDIPIEIIVREPQYFINKTGTKIIIRNLRNPWNRKMVREIYRALNSFCSPFETYESFRIIFETDKKEWLKGLLSWDSIKDYSLFYFRVVMKGNKISKFLYKFTPWQTMTKLKERIVDEDDEYLKKKIYMVDGDNNIINLDKFKIGPIVFEGYIFDLDPKILSLGVTDKKGLREYLKQNGGIRVYRDGIRVYDYGEPGNDWLDLGIRRVNQPAKRISNNIIVGAVYLKREESMGLVEKTNREGFIENEAFAEFKRALLYSLDLIEELRFIDKEKIRSEYGLKSKTRKEPVISPLKDLRKLINKKIKEESLRKEIDRHIDRIEKEYEEMRNILLRGAGAGLTLSIVIHEIEKIIDELKKVVEYEKPSSRILELVKHLSRLVEGYTIIIRKSNTKPWKVKKLIDQAIFNMEFRFRVHNIELIKDYEAKEDYEILCARNLVINSLINIMDNSIWWLEYKFKREPFAKKIFITVSEYMPGYVSIVIADNGPGLTLPPEEITKPFVSAKPDGMGLGLHIVDEIMKAHGGFLSFPEPDDLNLPTEFREGAIVLLAFKKEGVK